MKASVTLLYDGSFNGFLSTVYDAFDRKIGVCQIHRMNDEHTILFEDSVEVTTDKEKARRVWRGIESRSTYALKTCYFAFLSETKGVEYLLFRFICGIFNKAPGNLTPLSTKELLKLSEYSDRVGKEKRSLENKLRLEPIGEHFLMAEIQPVYNVLPLLSKYFRYTNRNTPWIIFDKKRGYGIYYHLTGTDIVNKEEIQSRLNELRRIQELSPTPQAAVIRRLRASKTVVAA